MWFSFFPIVLLLYISETSQSKKFRHGKFGKDPTVETSFLPDRCGISLSPPLALSVSLVLGLTFDLRGDEDTLSVRGRQRNKLSVKGCRDSGFLSRSRFEVILCSDTNKSLCECMKTKFLLSQAFCVFQMSLFKLLTATGMELAIGGCFR